MMTFHGGLTGISIGIVAILCLLIPDDIAADDEIAAGCVCNLNYTIRQLRNEKIEKIATEHITNYTANLNMDLSSATSPNFNLISQLTNYTKRTIVNFVLSGDIYSTDWVNFSTGYDIMNDSAIFQNYNYESETNTTWLTLANFLKRNYFCKIRQDLENDANRFTYQLGVFRPSSDRPYNYSSFDPSQTDSSPCICSTNEGFSYTVRFAIDDTSLPLFYDNETSRTGRLMKTDLELAIDNFTSYNYGESYIRSIFKSWGPSSNDSVFDVRLFFKNQYDYWWNSSTSDINSKLSNLTVFQLRYLNMTVNITSLPRTIACKTYKNSQEYTCDAVTAGPANSQTVQLSSTMLPSTQTTPSSTIASSALSSTMTQSVVEISSSTISTTTASLAPSQSSTTQLSGNTGNTGSTGLQSSQSTGYSVTAVPNPTSNNGSSGTNPSQNLQTETTTIPSMTNNSVNSGINSSITPFLNGSIQITTNLITGNGTLGQAGSTPSTTITPQIIVTSSTTPFDKDPLFKANADVPVMTKVYNDQLMLKGRGATGEPFNQQALFYSVAIPAAAGLILTTMLLLICLQIDWIGTAASSKSIA